MQPNKHEKLYAKAYSLLCEKISFDEIDEFCEMHMKVVESTKADILKKPRKKSLELEGMNIGGAAMLLVGGIYICRHFGIGAMFIWVVTMLFITFCVAGIVLGYKNK